jgi:hypothetical protein
MEYVIVFGIGFALGWFLQSWIMARAFHEILKDLDVPDEKILDLARRDGADVSEYEETAKTTIEVKVEQVGDRLMAYSAQDDAFIAQGEDAAALLEVVLNRYPVGHKVQIVEGVDLVRDHLEHLKQNG